MYCPYCGKEVLDVVNSRPTKSNAQIWRRRKCLACGEIITTYERIDLSYIKVIKREGKKEYYHRAKLYSGIYRATLSLKDVDKGEMAILSEDITQKIESILIKNKYKEISSDDLINLVTKNLIKYPSIMLNYLSYFKYSNNKVGYNLINKFITKLASKT